MMCKERITEDTISTMWYAGSDMRFRQGIGLFSFLTHIIMATGIFLNLKTGSDIIFRHLYANGYNKSFINQYYTR
jgi:hypothetical protein